LKEQLKYLIELQQFDARIQELEQSARALPEKLAPAKQDLAKLEGLLQMEKDELAKTEQWRKDQEFILQQETEAIQKAKTKLQASSSTKEFAAANRELEAKRRSMGEREEELLKVIDALEVSRKNIADHEGDVAKLRASVEAEETVILAKASELKQQVDAAMGERSGLADKVEERLLKRYETTRKQRGFALAHVVNGSCTGCHMKIPPQLNNELARGDSIEACPLCHRLLYSDVLLDDSPADG